MAVEDLLDGSGYQVMGRRNVELNFPFKCGLNTPLSISYHGNLQCLSVTVTHSSGFIMVNNYAVTHIPVVSAT